jgi:hypothetical protein
LFDSGEHFDGRVVLVAFLMKSMSCRKRVTSGAGGIRVAKCDKDQRPQLVDLPAMHPPQFHQRGLILPIVNL